MAAGGDHALGLLTLRQWCRWLLVSLAAQLGSVHPVAAGLLSDRFEVVTHCEPDCRLDVFLRSPGAPSRRLAVGFAGTRVVPSEDGRRCLVYGRLEDDLVPAAEDRRERNPEGIWLLDENGTARRLRRGDEVNHSRTSFLGVQTKLPQHEVMLYVPEASFDPRGWMRAATTEGVDTLRVLQGGSSAHRIALSGVPDDLAALSSAGTDLSAPNLLGMTPLELAILSGNEPVASRLCTLGAAHGDSMTRPLVWCVALGRIEALRAILGSRAGMRAARWHDRTLLHVAVACRSTWPLREDPRDEVLQFPASAADRVSPEGYRACVEALLGLGSDPRAVTDTGETPLHQLADAYVPADWKPEDRRFEGTLRAEVARRLLDAGANPNARTDRGNTALHCVVFPEYPEIAEPLIELLIERGADINAVNDGAQTPLEHLFTFYGEDVGGKAPSKKTMEMGAILAAHGARLDVPEKYRREIEKRLRRIQSADRGKR